MACERRLYSHAADVSRKHTEGVPSRGLERAPGGGRAGRPRDCRRPRARRPTWSPRRSPATSIGCAAWSTPERRSTPPTAGAAPRSPSPPAKDASRWCASCSSAAPIPPSARPSSIRARSPARSAAARSPKDCRPSASRSRSCCCSTAPTIASSRSRPRSRAATSSSRAPRSRAARSTSRASRSCALAPRSEARTSTSSSPAPAPVRSHRRRSSPPRSWRGSPVVSRRSRRRSRRHHPRRRLGAGGRRTAGRCDPRDRERAEHVPLREGRRRARVLRTSGHGRGRIGPKRPNGKWDLRRSVAEPVPGAAARLADYGARGPRPRAKNRPRASPRPGRGFAAATLPA